MENVNLLFQCQAFVYWLFNDEEYSHFIRKNIGTLKRVSDTFSHEKAIPLVQTLFRKCRQWEAKRIEYGISSIVAESAQAVKGKRVGSITRSRVQQLDYDLRAVLILWDLIGWKEDLICETLNLSQQQFRYQLNQARRFMVDLMDVKLAQPKEVAV